MSEYVRFSGWLGGPVVFELVAMVSPAPRPGCLAVRISQMGSRHEKGGSSTAKHSLSPPIDHQVSVEDQTDECLNDRSPEQTGVSVWLIAGNGEW